MTVHPDDISVRVLRGRARVTDIITWFTDPFLFLSLWETSPLAWIYKLLSSSLSLKTGEGRHERGCFGRLFSGSRRLQQSEQELISQSWAFCAEQVWRWRIFLKPTCAGALIVQAQALYALGNFEHALVSLLYFHLKSFLLLTKLHRTSPFGFFCFV